MKVIIACVFLFAFAFFVIFEHAFADNPSNAKYVICFCTNQNHAFVHLFDGSTGNGYSRGLWATDWRPVTEGAPIPQAGGPAPAGSDDSSGSSSSSSSGDDSSLSSWGSSSSGSSGPGSLGSGSNSALGIFDGKGAIKDEGRNAIRAAKCKCVSISQEDYNKAANYVNNYPRQYRLMSQNCVDFVQDVASELGIDLPSTRGYWGFISDPEKFWSELNKLRTTYIQLPQNDSARSTYVIGYKNETIPWIEKQTSRTHPAATQNNTQVGALPTDLHKTEEFSEQQYAVFLGTNQNPSHAEVTLQQENGNSELLIRNDGQIPIYGLLLNNPEDAILSVDFSNWNQYRFDENTMMIKTTNNPINPGKSDSIQVSLPSGTEYLEWLMGDKSENMIGGGLVIDQAADPRSVLLGIQGPQIPPWIKQNADWWSKGQIGDVDFASGIGYLVQQNIIRTNLPVSQDGTITISDDLVIPIWIRNNAMWWAAGQIGDSDFTSGIEYMINQKIISFSDIPAKPSSYLLRTSAIVTNFQSSISFNPNDDKMLLEMFYEVKSKLTAREFSDLVNFLDDEIMQERKSLGLPLQNDATISDLERARTLFTKFGGANLSMQWMDSGLIAVTANNAASHWISLIANYDAKMAKDQSSEAWDYYDQVKTNEARDAAVKAEKKANEANTDALNLSTIQQHSDNNLKTLRKSLDLTTNFEYSKWSDSNKQLFSFKNISNDLSLKGAINLAYTAKKEARNAIEDFNDGLGVNLGHGNKSFDATICDTAITNNIDAAAMELYLKYRNYESNIYNQDSCDMYHYLDMIANTSGIEFGDVGTPNEPQELPQPPLVSTPSQTDLQISANPTTLSFTHNIGKSSCPQKIGSVNLISNQPGHWNVLYQNSWMAGYVSGSSASIEFTCILTQYNTQSLSGQAFFTFTGDNGKTGQVSVSVTGQVNK